MIQIPTEILVLITSFLSTRDKIRCIRVCKAWYEIIANSNLYVDLTIENNMPFDFRSAMDLFVKKRRIANTVNNLCISWTSNKHTRTLMKLPEVFPKVRNVFISELFCDTDKIPSPEVFDYQKRFKRWNNLEYLTDRSLSPIFTKQIVLYSNLSNLKRLDITGDKPYDGENDITVLKLLRDHIQNLPSLEEFVLTSTAVRLEDVEVFHSKSPNLKKLTLKMSVDKHRWRHQRHVNITTLASKLEILNLSINIAGMYNDNTDNLDEFVFKWVSYINQKYKNLQNIALNAYAQRAYSLYLSTRIKEVVTSLLMESKPLTYLDMNLCPLSDEMINAMEKNKVQLKGLSLYLNDTSQNEHMVDTIRKSQLIKNVTILGIKIHEILVGRLEEISYLYSRILQLPASFQKVVDLTMDRLPKGSATLLFIHILPNLPVLEKLVVWFDKFGADESDSFASQYEVKEYSLNHVEVGFCPGEKTNTAVFNDVFRVFFQSCPLLEEVRISGGMRPVTNDNKELTLCFKNHFKLKKVDISLLSCKAYLFNGYEVVLNTYPSMFRTHRFHLIIDKPDVNVKLH
ncbi:uncharacterized protein EV154DRAFT_517361 [Mucor mucedo]|uniref:uncharacterized protein n=1 Tax=Mucor mucedo TaxID=29922 RepID=UPI0022202ED2|nr:uncharacterized protein EV154DRAFT_517361 [Mucor mucedo]KAI7888554.1 hypothetical protein EV154DRAFT_517361 [Mucor mucedo]